MSRTCWLDDGSPKRISDENQEVVAWISHLYQAQDCALGGMLHFIVYDYNVDDECFTADFSVFVDMYGSDYPQEVTELCGRIYNRMKSMSEGERSAVVASANGWL